MPKKPIFDQLAPYYDLIYTWKDYQKEAHKIKSLIKKYKKYDGNDLLEVACGTGKHTQYLKDDFSILATDVNKSMLIIAQKNNPDVKFKQVDMVKMDLHYLIAEKNQNMKHFIERHELALFDVDKVLSIMEKNGLKASFLKNGLMKDRGLYVGVKK